MSKKDKRQQLLEKMGVPQYSLLITFIALKEHLAFKISSDKPLDDLLAEFALLFSKTVDYENKRITIDSLQTVTLDLRENFKSL